LTLVQQLILESYGNKFILINRFNIGKDPVKTLSDRLFKLVDGHFRRGMNEIVRTLQAHASSLLNKTEKQCPICKENKEHKDYFDQLLKSGVGGYGRNCMAWKLVIKPESLTPKLKPRRRKWG
jgi:hypothetical protein